MSSTLFAVVTAAPLLILLQAPPDPRCTGTVSREDVVHCAGALAADVSLSRADIDVATARTMSARTVLPSNPTASVSVAHRRGPDRARAVNVYGSLEQEIAIAGQRTLRRRAARSEVAVEREQLEVVRFEVAARALHAYYDVLAARERLEMVKRSRAVATALAELARERAAAGVEVPLQADLARAAAKRLEQRELAMARELRIAHIDLAAAMGLDPVTASIEPQGGLQPLPVPNGSTEAAVEHALEHRPELHVVAKRRRMHEDASRSWQRARVPNPTLSVMAQRDGFEELVVGGGVSIPIPLPAPLGQTFKGEIETERALARRTDAERVVLQRRIQHEVAVANAAFVTAREEVAVLDAATLEQAQAALVALDEEIAAGRVQTRDALHAQQSLLELLEADVDGRHRLAIASVELARAMAAPVLSGGRS